jgi:xanthine dehydrogenase large subunit
MGEVHKAKGHDSGPLHVAGSAVYIDDMPEPAGLLHLAFGLSTKAHARIIGMDLSAVRACPGVVGVYTAADVPGDNNVGPLVHDEPLLADGEVLFHGAPIFLVAAQTREAARRAARLGRVEYEERPALVTVADAMAAGSVIEPAQRMGRGDVGAALSGAARRMTGTFEIGGQEHFYLEGQIAQAAPGEDGQMHVWSSTQHPSEVQHLVAHLIGRPSADVVVETRRLGGGFGGKETQASAPACACAMVAAITGRPARMRYDRDDDMTITGKRHDFVVNYDVGYDEAGHLAGLRIELASRCGISADVSASINDRAMFHADNAYWIPAVEIISHRLRTHTVSNTAYRGFGGPQGMIAIERIMDAIAADVGRDPLDVRRENLYGPGRDITPYGMQVADNIAPELMAELAASCDYAARREAVAAFNASHRLLKKGIALTPVKFGISFTATHLNQAGALVLVYADGSIQLNHGGIEMGQGLYTKVAAVVADVFAVPMSRIRITATRTDKVPNTSATAASSGSDMNGMAAYHAAMTIRTRMAEFFAARQGVAPEDVRFEADGVHAGDAVVPFSALARMAYMARVQLWSDGFYATPKIHYDRASHTGHPFYYFAYGAACSEVVIDTLTGEHKVLRTDILHDCGRSLNPAIDLGQIEGGFVQGMGWLTTEELVFAGDGRLLTHAPSTYKIPTASDRPVMNIALWARGENAEPTIHRSKAVGEPPFMLAISVFSALAEAVMATRPGVGLPRLDAPATPERILRAIDELAAR